MPITSVEKNLDDLTITIVADFAAPLARLWESTPRRAVLGSAPTYPATFVRHDVAVGGRSVYRMTGPEGDEHYGVLGVDWVSTPRTPSRSSTGSRMPRAHRTPTCPAPT